MGQFEIPCSHGIAAAEAILALERFERVMPIFCKDGDEAGGLSAIFCQQEDGFIDENLKRLQATRPRSHNRQGEGLLCLPRRVPQLPSLPLNRRDNRTCQLFGSRCEAMLALRTTQSGIRDGKAASRDSLACVGAFFPKSSSLFTG
jgi:hypothetical protein